MKSYRTDENLQISLLINYISVGSIQRTKNICVVQVQCYRVNGGGGGEEGGNGSSLSKSLFWHYRSRYGNYSSAKGEGGPHISYKRIFLAIKTWTLLDCIDRRGTLLLISASL